QGAGGGLDVLGADGALDVADGEATGGDGATVEPDAHGWGALAADLDAGDAVDGGEAVDEIALGVVGELERRDRLGSDAQPEDGFLRGVGLLHVRRISFLRQLA